MTPVDPSMKAIGRNTAESTITIPMSAEEISPMLFSVAVTASNPSSSITRSTFSTTTIASSTNRPMAKTNANMERVLIDMPKADSTPKVPSKTTGTAMVGMIVARQLCKKRKMTRKTRTIASINVS